MNQLAGIAKPAPELILSDWVQGTPKTLAQLESNVVLIEVFQINCPGCFLYSLPQAIDLHQRYSDKGLTVLGVATAFEDFKLNTLENLQQLIEQHIVVGETEKTLAKQGRLIDGRLAYHIPFAVAMDTIKQQRECTTEEVNRFIDQYVTDFHERKEAEQLYIKSQVIDYLNARLHSAETFKLYNLQGTPSHIIIDKKGILKACEFGHFTELEWLISGLLAE